MPYDRLIREPRGKMHWRRPRLTRIVSAVALAGSIVAAGLVTRDADAQNINPANDNSKYAWSENVGWLNAQPSGAPGPGLQVSATSVTGYLWGENIGWISASCQNDGSCGTVSYGVTNDGLGHLKGYAWGENVGWMSFSCQNNPASCAATGDFGVNIDIYGNFTGYAWGENIGWISFNCSNDSSCASTPYKVQTAWLMDADSDNCPDARELGASWLTGGQRDPNNQWDFFDMPVPALLPSQTTGTRHKAITLADVATVIAYVGTTAAQPNSANVNGATYGSDLNGNGMLDGQEYDRTPSANLSELWRSGPPNGSVTLQDALVALAQVGTNCN